MRPRGGFSGSGWGFLGCVIRKDLVRILVGFGDRVRLFFLSLNFYKNFTNQSSLALYMLLHTIRYIYLQVDHLGSSCNLNYKEAFFLHPWKFNLAFFAFEVQKILW